MVQKISYPFTAIVGQDEMKLALILNLINPSLGGVLIRGEKGTAKSTAVRGLCNLLEEVEVVNGCSFHCRLNSQNLCKDCADKENPEIIKYRRKVVELPISATEDRVVGALNIEKAIKQGEKSFEAGLLADANGNILYVDEINLLDDHIVDILLDSAAMGVNTVEREGVSYSHPAKFVLVGTMNPEEGDLRPQLLDRFGLVVEIRGEQDIELRSELIKRRLEFEENPQAFLNKWNNEEEKLRERIERAQKNLAKVTLSDEMYHIAATIGAKLGVDGHRADIVLLKTAQTLASFEGKTEVSKNDIFAVARLVLAHRMRKLPFDTTDGLPTDWEDVING